MLAIGILLAGSPQAQGGGTCAFDYVADTSLAATELVEVTDMQLNPSAFASVQKALPNVRRVFMFPEGNYVMLIGWDHLPEDYSRFSKHQVGAQLRETVEFGSRTINPGAKTTYHIDLDPPLAVFIRLDYVDEGVRHRDVAMDVIATPFCIFSAKFSGRVGPEDEAVWGLFQDEFERMRDVIVAREGPVRFSDTGVRFSVVGLANTVVGLAITIGCGAIAFLGIGWRYRIEWGGAAQRYSAIIVGLAAFSIVMTVLANEMLRGIPTRLPYETIAVFALVLATHLTALIKRTPRVTLAAVSLMIGTLCTSILYVVLGWMAFPRGGQLVGIVLGFVLLIYVLRGSLRSKVQTVVVG